MTNGERFACTPIEIWSQSILPDGGSNHAEHSRLEHPSLRRHYSSRSDARRRIRCRGLTLADVLRLRANAGETKPTKSVIMIWLRSGASHIDSYDMKPDAPVEVRGEFKPIQTNVTGIQVCEHMTKHA